MSWFGCRRGLADVVVVWSVGVDGGSRVWEIGWGVVVVDEVWGAGGPWIVGGMCGESVKVEGGDVDLSRWSFEEAEGARGIVDYRLACREVGEGGSVLGVWGAGVEWGVRELESYCGRRG